MISENGRPEATHVKEVGKINPKAEINFLEGPRSRWTEFKFTVKVMLEFIRGFRVLHFVGPCVTVFG